MESNYLFVLISLGIAALMGFLASRLAKLKSNTLFIGIFATIVGLLIGTLAYLPLKSLPGIFGQYLPIVFYVISVATSVWLFLKKRDIISKNFENIGKIISILTHPKFQFGVQPKQTIKNGTRKVVVDTSVLIDGRILDLVKTGFTPGKLVIPKFVVDELQYVADSNESLRRSKGRRGLDIIQDLKKELKKDFISTTLEYPEIKEVDAKLVHLAKEIGADVMTNDFNLNKVAKIEGVRVLNINELAQAMRPVIIPGEEMELKIIQAGKERNQGVGYLSDGTMIVVENGDNLIGKTVNVVIKRVLQTAAGKMYFATLK